MPDPGRPFSNLGSDALMSLVVLLMGSGHWPWGSDVLSQRWSDPDWAVFVGVCLMGWLAGTLVGLVYRGVQSDLSPRPRPAPRNASGEV